MAQRRRAGAARGSGSSGGSQRRAWAYAGCALVALTTGAGAADEVMAALRGARTGAPTRQLSQYMNPTYKGFHIDNCLRYQEVHYGPDNSLTSRRGVDCGKPAADKFCQMEGFPESEFWTAVYYDHNATWVLGDDELNPRDYNPGHGEHTYFDRISCRHEKPQEAAGNGTQAATTNGNSTRASGSNGR